MIRCLLLKQLAIWIDVLNIIYIYNMVNDLWFQGNILKTRNDKNDKIIGKSIPALYTYIMNLVMPAKGFPS